MLSTKPLEIQDGWDIASPGEAYFDTQALSDLTDWIEATYEYQNTHCVLIEHAGVLIYELYLNGPDTRYGDPPVHRKFDVDSLHDLRSISKSVTSLLFGLALQEDYIQVLSTPVIEYFDGRNIKLGVGAENVTIRDVLTMTAGFDWDEWNRPINDPKDDENLMHSVKDPVRMILGRRVIDPPGTAWNYNGALTELLADIVEQESGKRLDRFASEALFKPLGINSFEWLGSPNWLPTGRPSASSGLRMRARDLAKIGSLLLHNGVWNDKQVVSSEWINLSVQRHVYDATQGSRGSYGYGFQWWRGRSNGIPSYDIIAGFGNGGQQLLVVPELHLSVTVFAGNYNREGQGLFNWVLGRIALAHRNHN